jgi:hypothetical protein
MAACGLEHVCLLDLSHQLEVAEEDFEHDGRMILMCPSAELIQAKQPGHKIRLMT